MKGVLLGHFWQSYQCQLKPNLCKFTQYKIFLYNIDTDFIVVYANSM